LKWFYGRDDIPFSLTSEELPGVTRQFTSFSQAAQENADSRVWLGVHWRFDQTEGQKLGRDIANYIAANFLEPVATPGEDFDCMLSGPNPGTGYTMAEKSGDYVVNGRLDVRISASFLLQITPAMSFTPVTCTGSLTGTPSNASGGRLATADGYGTFRLATSAHAIVLDDFQMAPGMIETFEAFATTHTLSGNPEADADGDGVNDFAEYCFDTNPRVSDRPPHARLEDFGGTPVLIIRYHRRAGRLLAGLEMEPQGSVDLEDWNTIGVIDETDPEAAPIAGAEPRRARIPVPASGRVFLRLWARR
jgi:hypothetical protein